MDCKRRNRARKASVENETVPITMDKIDIISQLPEELIMHILSFLEPKDVIVTSTLAKKWVRISPKLDLSPKHISLNKAIELFQNYKNQGLSVRTYSLNIPDFPEYSACIDDWLKLASDNDICTLHIRLGFDRHVVFSPSKNLVVLSLQDCSLQGFKFSSGLNSLQELTLNNVKLTDHCAFNIAKFYNVRKLGLVYCFGIYNICFNFLSRLKKVEIWSDCNSSSYQIPSKSRGLSFSKCNNIETLLLHADLRNGIRLSETCFSDELPLLRKLILHGKCQMGKIFRIEHLSLEVLHLSYVNDMEGYIIKTPSLQTFKFKGKTFEPYLFTMKTGTHLRKVSLKFHETYPINAIWFSDLRRFVRNLGLFGVLSLRITNKIHLRSNSLEKYRNWPVCKLKLLKLKIVHGMEPLVCKDLMINFLLWGFRPKIIAIILTQEPKEYIEVLRKHLQNKKLPAQNCCVRSSSQYRCWRHKLKCADIELSSRVSKKKPCKDVFQLNIKLQW